MFQAVLKSILLKSEGRPVLNVREFIPRDVRNFSVDIELSVTLKGMNEGFERFDVEVCTPSWLERHMPESDCVMGAGLLLVRNYSYQSIFSCIEQYVEQCTGKNPEDVFRRVGLIGAWESEWEI